MEAKGYPFEVLYNGNTKKVHFKKSTIGCVCGYRPRKKNYCIVDTLAKWDGMVKLKLSRDPCEGCFNALTLPDGWRYQVGEKGHSFLCIQDLKHMGVSMGEVKPVPEKDDASSSDDSASEVSSNESDGSQQSEDSQAVAN